MSGSQAILVLRRMTLSKSTNIEFITHSISSQTCFLSASFTSKNASIAASPAFMTAMVPCQIPSSQSPSQAGGKLGIPGFHVG